MLCRDVMTSHVISVQMDESVWKVRDLFEQHGFHHLIVLDGEEVKGVVADRDLLKNLSPFIGNPHMERPQDERLLSRKVHQIMARNPVTVRTNTPVDEAAQVMLANRVSCLPVLSREGHLLGIVTWRDLLPLCFRNGDCDAAHDNAA